jgi:type I restriction enzyme S subunit
MSARQFKDWLDGSPADWKTDRLKDCFSSVVGGDWGDDPDSDAEGRDLVVLRVADFKNGSVKHDDLTVRRIKDSKISQRLIMGSSLLIEKSGGGENQWVGRVVFPGALPFEAICSNFIAKLDTAPKHEPAFFNYLLSALYHANVNRPHVRQTTGIQNLALHHYLGVNVALPAATEQKRIAAYLDASCAAIDRAVESKQQQLDTLDALRKSIIQRAVTQGLNPEVEMKDSGVAWVPKVPRHWKVARLKRHAQLIRGQFSARPRSDPRFYGGPYPFIQTGSISATDKYITEFTQTLNEDGLEVSRMFAAGTVVMTITGAKIGEVAVTTFDACFPDSIVGFIPDHTLDNDFLFYLLVAIKPSILEVIVVTTQPNINYVQLGGNCVPLPLLDEQKAIVRDLESRLKGLKDLRGCLHSQIETLTAYRKSLIHECVTGLRRINDADVTHVQAHV